MYFITARFYFFNNFNNNIQENEMTTTLLEPNYAMTVKIGNWETRLIESLHIVRKPIEKMATFLLMKLPIPLMIYIELERLIRHNKTPVAIIELYLTNTEELDNINEPIRKIPVFKKRYRIVYSTNLNALTIKKREITVKMVLMNEVLLYLNNNNSFNTIIDNTTAYDALLNYESFLKKTYGSNTFNFKKIGNLYKKNNFKYEQILVKAKNDLNVASNIINIYKTNESFSYYFFDEFKFDADNKNPICGLHINLGDLNRFKKVNIFDKKYGDFQKSLQLKNNIQSVIDPFNKILKNNPNIFFKDKDDKVTVVKNVDSNSVPNLVISQDDSQLSTERSFNGISVDISNKNTKTTQQQYVYTPDNVNNAKKRILEGQNILKNKIEALYPFYAKDVYFDVIQLDTSYILDPVMDYIEYLFVPINIVNIFYIHDVPTKTMKHDVAFTCLKYNGRE